VHGWALWIEAVPAFAGRRFQQHVVAAPGVKVVDHIETKRGT
jgi:hypothetical protein